jgi:hypothetical protein
MIAPGDGLKLNLVKGLDGPRAKTPRRGGAHTSAEAAEASRP